MHFAKHLSLGSAHPPAADVPVWTALCLHILTLTLSAVQMQPWTSAGILIMHLVLLLLMVLLSPD